VTHFRNLPIMVKSKPTVSGWIHSDGPDRPGDGFFEGLCLRYKLFSRLMHYQKGLLTNADSQ